MATAAERIITALNVFILVIRLCPYCHVSADALEADLGSQSADTIKLNVIQCDVLAKRAAGTPVHVRLTDHRRPNRIGERKLALGQEDQTEPGFRAACSHLSFLWSGAVRCS